MNSRRIAFVLCSFTMAVSLGLVAFSRPAAGEANDALPSWIDAQPSITKLADVAPADYSQQLSHTNFPCTQKELYTWGYGTSPGVPRSEYTQQGCFASIVGGEISGDLIVPYGARQAQQLVPDNLTRVSFFPAKNSSKLALVSNSYAYFYGGTPTLHLVDDWTHTFNNFQLDGYANVIRHSAANYHTFTKSDGNPIDIRTNGIAFSANGQWLHAVATNQAQILINTQTQEIIPYASYINSGSFAENVAVSNDGRYVAIAIPYQGMKLFDLQRCETAVGQLQSRNCQSRGDVYEQLKNYIRTDDLRIFQMEFMGANNNLDVSAAVHNAQDNTWSYAKYRLSLPNAQPSKYLALGDSFSSGEGAYDYRSPTDFYVDEFNYNVCHQSKNSYPYILQSLNKFEWFNSVACSGAMMDDTKYYKGTAIDYAKDRPQAKTIDAKDIVYEELHLKTLSPGYLPQDEFIKEYIPTTATVSIIGNDIGFGQIVTACILNKLTIVTSGECFSERNDREALAGLIDLQIPKLTQVLVDIKDKMGGSDPKLYVLGYPKVISPKGLCEPNSPLTSGEITFANNMVEYLDAAVKVAADAAGAQYVDVSNAFIDGDADYRLCGGQDRLAMNGIVLRGSTAKNPDNRYYSETFHPNKLGQSLMASAAQAQTSGLTKPMPQQKSSLDELAEKRVVLVGDSEKRLRNYTLLYDPNILGSNRISLQVVPKQKPLELNIESDDTLLPPADSEATIEFHSTPVSAGTLPIAPDGRISGTITVPASLPSGYHQLHVKYKDISGQTIDRYSYVYIAESEQDYDGDSKANSLDACPLGTESGVNRDKDGIDDACDDEYAQPVLSGVSDENTMVLGVSQKPADSGSVPKTAEFAAVTSWPVSDAGDEFGIAAEQKLGFSSVAEANSEKAQKTSSNTRSQASTAANLWPRTLVIVGVLMALLGMIVKFVWFPKS